MARSAKLSAAALQSASILVRVPNWVGDAVMTLPALRALRSAAPKARITLLARPWVRDVYPLDELQFDLIEYDSQSTHRGVGGRLAIARLLRSRRFDVALLFQNAFDAALVSWLARIPVRAGYARDGRGLLLTHPVEPPRKGETPRHESHYYLELLKRLGIIDTYEQVQSISLRPESFAREGREKLLTRLGLAPNTHSIVGISPGASFGTAKRWPAERFAELLRQLSNQTGATCLLFGSAQEAGLAAQIAAAAPEHTVLLAGKTSLHEFMELVAGCDAYLTNDTGTMHVAAALGVPTLAIFGPTNEHETAPLGRHVEMIVGQAECRPCKLRHCPYGHHQCMTSISPEQVCARLLPLLARPTSAD
jgi:heptosyltransferase-2